MLDRPEEYEKMAEAEGVHWWYRTLHQMILSTLREFAHAETEPIIDAGCGTGGLIQFLQGKCQA